MRWSKGKVLDGCTVADVQVCGGGSGCWKGHKRSRHSVKRLGVKHLGDKDVEMCCERLLTSAAEGHRENISISVYSKIKLLLKQIAQSRKDKKRWNYTGGHIHIQMGQCGHLLSRGQQLHCANSPTGLNQPTLPNNDEYEMPLHFAHVLQHIYCIYIF